MNAMLGELSKNATLAEGLITVLPAPTPELQLAILMASRAIRDVRRIADEQLVGKRLLHWRQNGLRFCHEHRYHNGEEPIPVYVGDTEHLTFIPYCFQCGAQLPDADLTSSQTVPTVIGVG